VSELAGTADLAEQPGEARQRGAALRPEGLRAVVRHLHGDFAGARSEPPLPVRV
jgi:hypothetical protein